LLIKELLSFDLKYEYHIFLSDNNSQQSDYSVLEAFCKKFSEVSLYRNMPHPGVTTSYNKLFEICRYATEITIRIDNDVTCNATAIEKIMTVFANNPNCAVVAPRLKVLDTNELNNGIRIIDERNGKISNIDSDKTVKTDVFLGAFYALRNECLKNQKFYDDSLVFFAEELEQSLRLREAGWDILYTPVDDCHHDCGLSTSRMSEFSEYLNFKNHTYIMNKYFKEYWYRRNLRIGISAVMRCIRISSISPLSGFIKSFYIKDNLQKWQSKFDSNL
jgi:GT2 family glycosyltransferase